MEALLLWLSLLVFVAHVRVYADLAGDDWRDEIPSAEEFLISVKFARIVFDVADTYNQNDEWNPLTPIVYMTGAEDTEYAIGTYDNTVYVCFRGTDIDVSVDVNANFDVEKIDFEVGGNVHKGYHEKVFGDWGTYGFITQTLEFIYRFFGRDDDLNGLVICGHSQGGALATLYGAYLAAQWPDRRVSVHNIGSPRVGDGEFKQALRDDLPNLAVYRVVFEEDAVARFPYRFMGYQHVGHLLMMDGTGKTTAYFQQTGDESQLYGGIPDSEWDVNYLDITDITDPLDDHRHMEYLNGVEKAVANEDELWPTTFQRLQERYCCSRFIICLRYCYRDL